jgi:ABC-2 type transport system permease protein
VSTGVLQETWDRNLLNLMVTPMREVEYAAGVALFGLAKLLLGLGLVGAVMAGLYSFDLATFGWEVVPIVGLLLASGWIISLFVIGCVLRFGPGAEALAWGVLFLALPLSGVFYPVDALPAVLRPISLALPTTHAFRAARGLLDGGTLDGRALLTSLALTVAMGAVGMAFVTRMLGTFRARGSIKRFI